MDQSAQSEDRPIGEPINLLHRELQRSLPQALIYPDVEIDNTNYALVAVTASGGKIAIYLIEHVTSHREYRDHRRRLQRQGVLLIPIFTLDALQIEEERLIDEEPLLIKSNTLPLLLMLNGDEVFFVSADNLYGARPAPGSIQQARANTGEGEGVFTRPQHITDGMLRLLHGSLIID